MKEKKSICSHCLGYKYRVVIAFTRNVFKNVFMGGGVFEFPNYSKGNTRDTCERRDGAQMGFPEHVNTISY